MISIIQHIALVQKELNLHSNEQYIYQHRSLDLDLKAGTPNFCVFRSQDSDEYIKVYPKDIVPSPDPLKHLLSRYDFLPKFVLETDNYIGVEWYPENEWTIPNPIDFINVNIRELYDYLNLSNYNPQATAFLKSVISSFHNLYVNEQFDITLNELLKTVDKWPMTSQLDYMDELYDLPLINYVTWVPDNIEINNFVVKRDVNGNIVDWKYTGVTRWMQGAPKYVFSISSEKLRHDKTIPVLDAPTVSVWDGKKHNELFPIDTLSN